MNATPAAQETASCFRLLRPLALLTLLLALLVGGSGTARAVSWSTVTVDAAGTVGGYSSIEVHANGDPVISYYESGGASDLKVAVCDVSTSANGNCDQAGDWSTVIVELAGNGGMSSSMAMDANGDLVISYHQSGVANDLKFAICDISASMNGNCDQSGDWDKVTVDSPDDVGYYTSIVVDANGDPVISYYDWTSEDLKFAVCDRSASTNGNCDQTGDWSTTTVDSAGQVGEYTSIAVDSNGDPMISYYDGSTQDLKFAVCDLSGSTNGNCDQTGDWSAATVDSAGMVGMYTSIAVDANGDPMISYHDGSTQDLKFAVCDLSASTNGNCDQTGDWSTATADSAGTVGLFMSIAVDGNGDPVISYYDAGPNNDLKFVTCDMSASVNGNCDQSGDWSSETVDSAQDVGQFTSIAVDAYGDLVISYYNTTTQDLKFATSAPVTTFHAVDSTGDAGDFSTADGVCDTDDSGGDRQDRLQHRACGPEDDLAGQRPARHHWPGDHRRHHPAGLRRQPDCRAGRKRRGGGCRRAESLDRGQQGAGARG
jgi:hypothetical protein